MSSDRPLRRRPTSETSAPAQPRTGGGHHSVAGVLLRVIGIVTVIASLWTAADATSLPADARVSLAVQGTLGGLLLFAFGTLIHAVEDAAHWTRRTAELLEQRRNPPEAGLG